MTNLDQMNIEELHAAWAVAYDYFKLFPTDETGKTLDAISAAFKAAVAERAGK